MKRLFNCMAVAIVLLAALPAKGGLQALGSSQVPVGCGCRFAASAERSAGPLLYWSWEGARQASMRDGDRLYQLDLRTERYLPQKREKPRFGDRIVLFFADNRWRIQIAGTAEDACAASARQCPRAFYKARLIVQDQGGAQQPHDVVGICGCNKP